MKFSENVTNFTGDPEHCLDRGTFKGFSYHCTHKEYWRRWALALSKRTVLVYHSDIRLP